MRIIAGEAIPATLPPSVMRLPLAVETSYYPYMKVKEVIRQFKHPTKAGAVTVSGKPSVDVPLGTLNSILKQAGLK